MKLSIKNPNTNEVNEIKPFDSYMTSEMDLIKELMWLCIEKNETTKHDVFFSLYGHINSISVSYFENGYADNKDSTYILCAVGVDEKEKLQQAINELKELV